MRIHFPTLEIAGVGVEPTSNGAGSPHACVGWATEAPVRMEAVRGHSPGGGPVVGRTCIRGCGHKGVVTTWWSSEEHAGSAGPRATPLAPCDLARPGGGEGQTQDVWTWTMCFTMCIAVVRKKNTDMVAVQKGNTK